MNQQIFCFNKHKGGRSVPVIEICNLSKFFGKRPALMEANLKVEEGEFFGFVGPNGSGKSTTIRILMNYIRPTSGSAKIFGMDVIRDSAKIRQHVGYVPSDLDFFEDMTAGSLIQYAAQLRHWKDQDTIGELCELFELDTSRTIAKMSLGNRKKIALVCALFHSPRLLLLDEASTGLDSLIKKRFKDYLLDCNQNGTTIFYCSHDMTEIQELCERTAIIRGGSILEVSEVSALSSSDSRRVIVKTKDDLSAVFALLHIQQTITLGDYICFAYHGSMDDLIKALACFHVEDIQIGLPSLEDSIIRFYEKKMENERGARS